MGQLISGLCDELIRRSEDCYRKCVCLILFDLETLILSRFRPQFGCYNAEKMYNF